MIGVMDSVNELTEVVGQNRMELLLFKLSGLRQRYGINVFKVREVLPCPRLTVMPKLQKYVIGVAHIRGQTISVIDLAYAIGGRPSRDIDKCFIIIAEYNRSTHAFLVSSVERILNMNWDKIMPPPKGAGDSNYMTAVTEIDGELVEILKPKVLIADDSRVALNQVTAAMEKLNLEVIKAHDGREAYNILREMAAKGPINQQVALVISDVEMPEMDGYTLCASIRKDPSLKPAYVILHTSLSGVFNLGMVSKAGANDFIPKFNPLELAKAVKKGIILTNAGKSGADLVMGKEVKEKQ